MGAYFLWGFFPLYFQLLKHIGALEVIVHRSVWSLVTCFVILLALRHLGELRAVLSDKAALWRLALAGLLIIANWTTYVYAVQSGHTVDAALGYFINPLVTVFFGVVFLRERLTPLQKIAISLGAVAVLYLLAATLSLPWISLVLAFSFGAYSLVKKRVADRVPAITGMVVENLAVLPLLLGYLVVLWVRGESDFVNLVDSGSPWWPMALLLVLAGVITAIPLVMFAQASRKLPLTALGLMQYISPIMQLLLGVLVFHEAVSTQRWIATFIVWGALVFLTLDSFRTLRKMPRRISS